MPRPAISASFRRKAISSPDVSLPGSSRSGMHGCRLESCQAAVNSETPGRVASRERQSGDSSLHRAWSPSGPGSGSCCRAWIASDANFRLPSLPELRRLSSTPLRPSTPRANGSQRSLRRRSARLLKAGPQNHSMHGLQLCLSRLPWRRGLDPAAPAPPQNLPRVDFSDLRWSRMSARPLRGSKLRWTTARSVSHYGGRLVRRPGRPACWPATRCLPSAVFVHCSTDAGPSTSG